jgi:hypothetical protein
MGRMMLLGGFLALFACTAGPVIAGNEPDDIVEGAALRALGIDPTPDKITAITAWDRCTKAAIDRYADQPEPARTVAEAAIAACQIEEVRYMQALGLKFLESVTETAIPELTAHVMEVRAARGKPGNK